MAPSADKLSPEARAAMRAEPRAGGVMGAAAGTVALYAVGLMLPVPFLMICPFPLVLVRLRGTAGPAVMATLLAAALLLALFGPAQALLFLCGFALPGYVLAETMARGRGLVRGAGYAFAVLTVQILLALLFAEPTMSGAMLDRVEAMRSPDQLQLLQSWGWGAEQISDWKEQVAAWHLATSILFPALWIVLGALLVLANAVLLRTYLAKRDPGWLDGGEFETIRWPLGLAVLFVAAGLAVLAAPLRPAAYNVLLVLGFFFALQGLAVVLYYAHRLAGPPLLRMAVLMLVLVNPWAPHILALVGLFDNWIDFRSWAEPPEAKRT
jgi:uncharacterized protein YybS (DUF2232 family)